MSRDLTPSEMICELYQHIRLNGHHMGSCFHDPTWQLGNAYASLEEDGCKRIEWPGIGLDVSEIGGRVTYNEGCQKQLNVAYQNLVSVTEGGAS